MLRKGKTTPLLRAAMLVVATMHVSATAALPTVDGLLDADTGSAPMHVESPGSEECDAHHDHLFCQVVRTLSDGVRGPTPRAALLEHPIVLRGTDHDGCELVLRTRLPGAIHPRAPPLA